MMIIIFTENANNSKHVGRELANADKYEKSLFLIKIEDAVLSKKFAYIFNEIKWYNATEPPIEKHFPKILELIKKNLITRKSDKKMELEDILKRMNWKALEYYDIMYKEDISALLSPKTNKKGTIVGCLVQRGKAEEKICQFLYKNYSGSSYYPTLTEIIQYLKKQKRISFYIHSCMDKIRRDINLTKHENVTKDELIRVVHEQESTLLVILEWFLTNPFQEITNKPGLIDAPIKELEKDSVTELRQKWKKDFDEHFTRGFFVDPLIYPFKEEIEDQEEVLVPYDEFKEEFLNTKSRGKVILLLGDAGIGKSTFLNALKFDILNESQLNILPILMEFSYDIPREDQYLNQLLNIFYKQCWSFENEEYYKEFNKALQVGRIVLLLDGLDEYFVRISANVKLLGECLRLLKKFAATYNVQILITSRPTIWTRKALISQKIPKNNIYELTKWDKDLIKIWIKRNSMRWEANWSEIYSDKFIFKKLKQISSVLELCRTPFLLTCYVYNFGNFIDPKNRGKVLNKSEIYKFIIDAQIERNDKMVDDTLELDNEVIHDMYRCIALECLNNQNDNIFIDDIDFTQFSFLTDERVKLICYIKEKHKNRFSTLLKNHSFLNINNSGGIIFAHPSFAEFIIAETVYKSLILRNSTQDQYQALQYFSAKYFTLETLELLIELVKLTKDKKKVKLYLDDFIRFLKDNSDFELIDRLLIFLDSLYDDDDDTLRKDLIRLIQEGLNCQKKFSLNLKSFEISRIMKFFDNLEILENILANKDLVYLKLKGCNFHSIPEKIFDLNKLNELHILGWENLKQIPDSIEKLRNLRVLYLKGVKLTSLTKSIGNLENLEELTLLNCQLNSLPESIGKLANLKKLNLGINNFTSLSVGNLSNLEKLYLNNNQITTLPESIKNLENLKLLKLNNNSIGAFPKLVYNLTNLQELYLSNNNIPSLANLIGNLINLERLYLDGTKIRTIPDSISKLENLKMLDLKQNKIPSLTKDLKKALKKLRNQGCEIIGLPFSF